MGPPRVCDHSTLRVLKLEPSPDGQAELWRSWVLRSSACRAPGAPKLSACWWAGTSPNCWLQSPGVLRLVLVHWWAGPGPEPSGGQLGPGRTEGSEDAKAASLLGGCVPAWLAAWSVIPVLMLTGWQVRPGPGTKKLAWGFQKGACQDQCPCGRKCSPKSCCLCPDGKSQLPPDFPVTLQDQQVGLTQTPFKLLLLPWFLGHVRVCVLYRVSTTLWLC